MPEFELSMMYPAFSMACYTLAMLLIIRLPLSLVRQLFKSADHLCRDELTLKLCMSLKNKLTSVNF